MKPWISASSWARGLRNPGGEFATFNLPSHEVAAEVEEYPVAVGISPEAIATLLLIFLNKKEDQSGKMVIQWGYKSYEFKDLRELTQKGLITNPIGRFDPKSLWLTPAGAALGSIIKDILLPEIQRLSGSLEPKEVKDAK